jgi:hypothetical protein
MPSFFHRPKPRQFHLTPRYYDEHKERIAESRKRVGLDNENKENDTNAYYSSSIKGKFGNVTSNLKNKNRQNIGIGIAIGVIALILYFFF